MWFKEFFIGIIFAYIDAIPTITGGAYEGNIYYGLIGVPLISCFILGIIKILGWSKDIFGGYWGRLKTKRKMKNINKE